MLSTGTYKIANLMTDNGVLTFLHKEYKAKEHLENLEKLRHTRYVGITSGVQSWDKEKPKLGHLFQRMIISVTSRQCVARIVLPPKAKPANFLNTRCFSYPIITLRVVQNEGALSVDPL